MIELHRYLSAPTGSQLAPPAEWPLAVMMRDFGALPLAGGLLDQPWGALVSAAALLDYARDFAAYQELGDKAPASVRARVLLMARRAAGRAH